MTATVIIGGRRIFGSLRTWTLMGAREELEEPVEDEREEETEDYDEEEDEYGGFGGRLGLLFHTWYHMLTTYHYH
jgi:hypothetical protein